MEAEIKHGSGLGENNNSRTCAMSANLAPAQLSLTRLCGCHEQRNYALPMTAMACLQKQAEHSKKKKKGTWRARGRSVSKEIGLPRTKYVALATSRIKDGTRSQCRLSLDAMRSDLHQAALRRALWDKMGKCGMSDPRKNSDAMSGRTHAAACYSGCTQLLPLLSRTSYSAGRHSKPKGFLPREKYCSDLITWCS